MCSVDLLNLTMGHRTTITSKGVVTRKGDAGGLGIAANSENTGFSPNSITVTAVTADSTLTAGGVYTVSGSAIITTTLPSPTSNAGSWLTLRALSAHAHVISGSATTDGTDDGAVITLDGVVGTSVGLLSDGLTYLVMGSSGTLAFSG